MATRKVEKPDPLLIDEESHRACLLGNEGIVRGALEAGVAFAAGYPGTPSSEVTDSFARVAQQAGIVFEYAVNEKIAIEMAFAASLAGARSLCSMKHLGLMYAGDPLSTIPYVGTVAGMLIVSAGDPSCRTSPNEQDQRLLAPMLHIPVLDPATSDEAYHMARVAFDLSEACSLPVLMRPTTRVCHSRSVIRYGRLSTPNVTGFERDPARFVPIPHNARRLRDELADRVERARGWMGRFLRVEGSASKVVLASGSPAATCADLIDAGGLVSGLRFVTMGGVYPLPEKELIEALAGADEVLVVEELSPYIEDAVRSLCARSGLAARVLGKRTGHLPIAFEYEPDTIQRAIHEGLRLGVSPKTPRQATPAPPRPPSLCPGCPHRATQFAARTVFGDKALYFNDIGCYTLGYGPPLQTADALLCMGAGFSLAAGVSRVTGQRTVGIMGDSTFFHSGMPPLLDAVKENVDMVAVILDNQVTAMTGFQESPTVEMCGDRIGRRVDIGELVRALGVRHVEKVDPYDLPSTLSAFERARDRTGVSVVIAERTCPVHHARQTGRAYKTATFAIDPARCRTCGREELGLRCGQEPSERFERHMAKSRALEIQHDRDRPGRAPCSAACPLGLCIQGFVGQIAAGDYPAALEHILVQTVLPESVCRVCHRPCEKACERRDIDEPIAVNDLKRFVVEWSQRTGHRAEPERDAASGKRVAVVGAGPAGLAAAYDAWLRGHAVTLFDRDDAPGGLLRTGIPAYRLPRAALDRDVARITEHVDFRPRTALGRDITIEGLFEEGFDAVILAIGAQRGIPLRLPGEGPRVDDALDYLRGVNLGRSRCEPGPRRSAVHDTAAQTAGSGTARKVVVVGGGNAAVDAARCAIRCGAERVTIVYRRGLDEMPAWDEEIEAAREEGVELMTRLVPTGLTAEGLVCLKTEPGAPDASGRSRPVPVPGSETVVAADQILAAIGQAPDPRVFGRVGPACDDGDAVQVDPETLATSQPGVFAVGDATAGQRTVTDAIAAGRRAAWAVDRTLRGDELADHRPPPPRPDPAATAATASMGSRAPGPRWTGPRVERVDHRPRQRAARAAPGARVRDFREVASAFSEEQAAREAARCMVCGLCASCRVCLDLFGCPAFYVEGDRIRIDAELCMGCGVCAEICPNGAIVQVSTPPGDPGVSPPVGGAIEPSGEASAP